MKTSGASEGPSASDLISKRIAELADWRGEALGRMRALIKEADPEVVEEWKWMGTPVWSHDGIICTGESYKSVVKLTFAKGASLEDPARLFNSNLEGNVRRAIDIREGEEVDASAFKALVRQAVALNRSGKAKPTKKAKGKFIAERPSRSAAAQLNSNSAPRPSRPSQQTPPPPAPGGPCSGSWRPGRRRAARRSARRRRRRPRPSPFPTWRSCRARNDRQGPCRRDGRCRSEPACSRCRHGR